MKDNNEFLLQEIKVENSSNTTEPETTGIGFGCVGNSCTSSSWGFSADKELTG